MDYIDKLVYISKYVGMRKDYVQAGGGNTSVKISNELMYIKSSGMALSDMNREDGYSLINYKMIKNSLLEYNKNNIYNEEIINKSLINGRKPSIETFLHSITPKYTIHIHSTIINILTCQKNGISILKKLFPTAIFVDYALPGIELGNKVFEKYKNTRKNELIFLKNHGIIVSSNNYLKVVDDLERIVNKISNYLNIDISRYTKSSYLFKLYKKLDYQFSNLIYLTEDNYIKLAIKKNNYHLWNYLLFPDSVVYCGTESIEIKNKDENEILKILKIHNDANIILFDEDVYIKAKSLKYAKEIEDVLSNSAQIYLNSKEKLDYIDSKEQKKLLKVMLKSIEKIYYNKEVIIIKPIVIGIAGDSATGKSTFSNLIKNKFLKEEAIIIEGDSYHKWERNNYHWKKYTHLNPKANYLDKQLNDIEMLKNNKSIKKKNYNHELGKFSKYEIINPKQYIIINGLHTLFLKQMRDVINFKIYMDAEYNLKKLWKINRDCKERNHSKKNTMKIIEKRHNDYIKYVYPQIEYADMIIIYYDKELMNNPELIKTDYNPKISLKIILNNQIKTNEIIKKIKECGINITNIKLLNKQILFMDYNDINKIEIFMEKINNVLKTK